jgi:hypothetical protein
MSMRLGNDRYSADSDAGRHSQVAESSSSVGGQFYDEVGVESCADPF